MITANGFSKALAVQAFAETSPQFSESTFAPRSALELQHLYASYGAIYQVQPHVFAVVEKIASLIARLGVRVWDTAPESGDKLDRKGPYARLMKDPCFTVPPRRFYGWISRTYEIYGEAFLLKSRGPNGKIESFIPMHPAMTNVRRAESGILHYQFMSQPNIWFPESEIVPFISYNPNTTMRGLSRLEPLRTTMMSETASTKASLNWWDNMGRPSFVLSTPKRLGIKGRANLRAGVKSSVGGLDNAGGILVLEDEVTATRMQLDAEEMQYIQTRKLDRGTVCTVYDINPEHIQIIDQLNSARGSTDISGEVYKTSIDFRLKDIEDVFNYHVASEFNGEREMRFNVSQQLRGDVETLAPAAVQLVQSGIAKPAEVREWFDFDDAGKLADELYANQALQPLGALSASAKADAEGMVKPPKPGELPTSPNATNTQSPKTTGDLPKKVPELTDKAMKYKGDIFSGLGRGKTWDQVAEQLMNRNPLDRKEIHLACLHILMEQP